MPGDYFALMKPRVMRLVVFTALVGMLLAPGSIDPVLGCHRHSVHRHRGRGLRRPEHVV